MNTPAASRAMRLARTSRRHPRCPTLTARWATVTTADGPLGRLATTDTAASRLVQLGDWSGTDPTTHRVHTSAPTLWLVDAGEPSFEITGTARDLDAWMWNRPTLREILRTGDTSVFELLLGQGV